MKRFQPRLQAAAKERGVTSVVVERDYIQSYILASLAAITVAVIQVTK